MNQQDFVIFGLRYKASTYYAGAFDSTGTQRKMLCHYGCRYGCIVYCT